MKLVCVYRVAIIPELIALQAELPKPQFKAHVAQLPECPASGQDTPQRTEQLVEAAIAEGLRNVQQQFGDSYTIEFHSFSILPNEC
ncbi:MAG: hypothetical protein V1723_01620 [Candidatus Uhrbacteria bacterium]